VSRGDFRLEADRTRDTVVARLAGDLDMAATFRLEPELERLARESDVSTLAVDMAGVEFIDSSGLGLILATDQRLRADGIRLVVANPSDRVRDLLRLTDAGSEVPVTDWPPDAGA
jgi:anti-anti-sigma factor